ncbi:MAG: M48 family metalloprotease [Pirellulales bacterium]|nr:M48 family metalloprotease [Pirellulales bacterium]
MHVTARCPQCGTSLKIRAELAGKRGQCPKCRAILRVPELANQAKGVPDASPPSAAAVPRTAAEHPAAGLAAAAPPAFEDEATRRRRLLEALAGEIKPVRKSPAYLLALPLVAVFMILLPLLYLGLIAAAGWLVYYHAVHHTGMLSYGVGRAWIFILGAYLAPIVSGVILVFFMIKPLFARPAQQVRTRSLTPQGEPILFAVVARLCELVGAPHPKRIDVDYQFNAFAGYRRGFWSMLGNDFVLTIGIPLAAGLSLRQLVGVLAHEFGHFSQGTGTRLSYIIGSINAWFARLVYQRDTWDVWLAETTEQVDFRIGWVLALSMLFVWLSRGILWVLMVLGHAISCILLRQREYDADRYEARVVGSETFASTCMRMQMLGSAYQFAQIKVLEFLQEGCYPDNLSRLTTFLHDRMPPEVRQEIETAAEQSRTGLFDTHPCDKARIANVRREKAPGVFQAEGPASALFCHFDALARNVTWDLYCQLVGPRLKPSEMKPVEELLKPS